MYNSCCSPWRWDIVLHIHLEIWDVFITVLLPFKQLYFQLLIYSTTYLPWNLRCFCNSFNTIQVTLFPIGIASSSSELVELFKGLRLNLLIYPVIRKFNQCMVELFKGWTFWYIPLSENSTNVWLNYGWYIPFVDFK